MRNKNANLYILTNLNGKIIERGVTSKYLEEEYGIKQASRAAQRCDRVQGKFRVYIID